MERNVAVPIYLGFFASLFFLVRRLLAVCLRDLLYHLVIVITAGPLPAPARTGWLHQAVDLALRQSPIKQRC